MAESPYSISDVKEYDVRSAGIIVGGHEIHDLESFGWDSSKGHEVQPTIDNNRIWVKAVPEITGSVVMKATSPSIPAVRAIYTSDQIFDIDAKLAHNTDGAGVPGGDGAAEDAIHFTGCMITDYSRDDHEIDGAPTVTIDWEGVDTS